MKRYLLSSLVVIVCLQIISSNSVVLAKKQYQKPKVAIIIDDAGTKGGYYKKLFTLPAKITVAIIPATVRAKEIAKKARSKGFEVIGHIPMEPLRKNIESTRLLRTSMKEKELRKNLRFYLNNLPGIKGINNHMGSKISVDRNSLKIIMQELQKRKMFIIDSRTNSKSIIPDVARFYGVKCLASDVFLDGNKDEQVIEEKLHRLISLAKKRGYAVGIGHIHRKAMLDALAKIMKKYRKQVQFVGVSELIYDKKTRNKYRQERYKKKVEQKQKDNLNLEKKDPLGEELEKIFF